MTFPLTVPDSSVEAKLASWGFITVKHGTGGLDYHEKYWFNSELEMVFSSALAPPATRLTIDRLRLCSCQLFKERETI